MLIAHGDGLKSLILLLVLGSWRHSTSGCFCSITNGRPRDMRPGSAAFSAIPAGESPICGAMGRSPSKSDIRRYCDAHRIDFLGVDSVGLACDGKLGDDDTAIRFHRALGTLPPSLCAAHVPKCSMGPDGKGDAIGPFGSVFFSNSAASPGS